MNIKTFVFTFDSVNDCNKNIGDSICTNLVNEFTNLFNICIAFGGNTENIGCPAKKSSNVFS